MKAETVNALSSAVIAFVTIVGLLVGLYFNLKETTKFHYILIFELLLIIAVLFIVAWLHHKLKEVH